MRSRPPPGGSFCQPRSARRPMISCALPAHPWQVIVFDFLQLKNSVRSLADEPAGLRGEIEGRKQRCDFLRVAPLCPKD